MMFKSTCLRDMPTHCYRRMLYRCISQFRRTKSYSKWKIELQRSEIVLQKRRVHCSVSSQQRGPPWKILFFGTDEFAAHHLASLHQEQLKNVKALVDRLDVLVCTEKCDVLKYAIDNNLTVHRWPVTDIDNQYDVGVIVSFGHLIPKRIIEKFPMGMLNVHPSLLPAWRGASPIIHTILNGDSMSGISIMSIQPKRFDTGPLLARQEVPVPQGLTSLQLMRYMAGQGSSLLLDCLRDLATKPLQTQPSQTTTPYAHKLKSRHSYIHWEKQCMHHIDRQYRALSDINPLRTKLGDRIVKLIDMEYLSNDTLSVLPHLSVSSPPGTPVYHKKQNLLYVRCKDGWVGFRKVLLKKPMSPLAFHNGYLSKEKNSSLRFTSLENDLDYFWR